MGRGDREEPSSREDSGDGGRRGKAGNISTMVNVMAMVTMVTMVMMVMVVMVMVMVIPALLWCWSSLQGEKEEEGEARGRGCPANHCSYFFI